MSLIFSDVLLTTTCLASWKRYHSVLFQTISNVFDVICCQLIWNACTSTYLYMPLGFCIPEWIQNGIHFESGINRGWWRFPPQNKIGLFSVVLLYFLVVSVAYLNSEIPFDIRFYFSTSPVYIYIYLSILHLAVFRWRMMLPLQWKIQIQNPESTNLRGRGTSPYGEPRESQRCFFFRD